jgi:hypothetical protein
VIARPCIVSRSRGWLVRAVATCARAGLASLGIALATLPATLASTGCGPDAVSNDRTGGYELSYRWTNAAEDKRLYFTVDRKGSFGSGGGLKAAQRETTYTVALSDAEIAEFVSLVRATGFAQRAEESGVSGELHIVVVRERGEKHAFEVRGADASLDALREWCQSISLRQFRDVIDSQPEAGPRRR